MRILEIADICVCCGCYVPEGEQVCPQCRSNVKQTVSQQDCSYEYGNGHYGSQLSEIILAVMARLRGQGLKSQ